MNHELEDGTYQAVSNDAVRIESKSTTDESVFDVFYAAINVQLMAAKLADLSNGNTFISSQKFPITDSSAYFVVTNGQVGPTTDLDAVLEEPQPIAAKDRKAQRDRLLACLQLP